VGGFPSEIGDVDAEEGRGACSYRMNVEDVVKGWFQARIHCDRSSHTCPSARRDEQFEITVVVDCRTARLSRPDVVGVPACRRPKWSGTPVVTLNSDQSRNRLSRQDLVSGVLPPRIEVPHGTRTAPPRRSC